MKHIPYAFFPTILYLLPFLFAACSTSNGNIAGTTSQPPAMPIATGTVQSSSTAGTGQLRLFTSTEQGYVIGYPQDWTITEAQSNPFGGSKVFTDPHNTAISLLVYATLDEFPSEQIAQDFVENMALNGAKPITVSRTLKMANGTTWSRGAYLFPTLPNGKQLQYMLLVTENPHNGSKYKHYEILLQAPPALFEQAEKVYFLPMLESFRIR
jgi:hypothetical protein